MIDVLYDMETADPDDGAALCILCAHPLINLIGVNVTPGTKKQIGVIKELLKINDHLSIPIGSFNPEHPKECVASFWTNVLGEHSCYPDFKGWQNLDNLLTIYPNLTLITGAPLKNGGAFLENSNKNLNKWVAQGGFAGDSVVPEKYRLDKFKGKETCPTFNFNGDPRSALNMLSTDRILSRTLVSKNVCHGVNYDRSTHEWFRNAVKNYPKYNPFIWFMNRYLEKHPSKLFHDPLAIAVAIEENICEYRNVEVYREKGEWGSKILESSNTKISINVDFDKMLLTLAGRNYY